jgi:hypothetical protein
MTERGESGYLVIAFSPRSTVGVHLDQAVTSKAKDMNG